MTTTAALLLVVAGLAHVGFWVLESLLWRRRAVQRMFGAADAATATAQAPVFFNIGFYNLMVGLGAIVGAGLLLANGAVTLAVYTALFMVGAGVVLVARSPAMWRGALVQALLPAVALVLIAVGG